MNAVFAKVNEAGGIDGHKVTLVAKDDAYDPTKTPPLATELVEKDHVLGLGVPGRHAERRRNPGDLRGRVHAAAVRRRRASRTGVTRPTTRGPSAASWPTTPRPMMWGEFIAKKKPGRQDRRAHVQQRLRQGVLDHDEAGRQGQGLHDRRQRAARGHRHVDRQRDHQDPGRRTPTSCSARRRARSARS